MVNSEFIEPTEPGLTNSPEIITEIPTKKHSPFGCYIVKISGKHYFMKKLKDEHLHNITFRDLLRKEFEVGSMLKHHNVVSYESIVDDNNSYYLLLENIVGETLTDFLKSNPNYFRSQSNLDKFFNQLLRALKCLHENHVVHSDLKPDNIMITQINNDVKLIDLGFCYTDSYTNTVGTTKGFEAPEHLEHGQINATTDIYGLGKIIEYIGQNVSHKLPKYYGKIMKKCLKHRQSERFQSTDEIVTEIKRRHRYPILHIVFALLICLGLFTGYKILSYNDEFISWWDSFQIFPHDVDYDVDYDHSYYRIISETEGTCEAVGHSPSPNVYLHDIISFNRKEYRLIQVADSAFFRKGYIKSVYLPEGLISIGDNAFIGCRNLLSLNIPSSVRVIEDNAFYDCRSLRYINLPPNITVLSRRLFAGSGLQKVRIPEGVTEIMLDAFGNCSALEEVELPLSLKRIERGVFWNCSSLKKITIPAQVNHLGEFLFFGCDNLTDIYNYSAEPQIIPRIHRNPKQITLHVPAESIDKYKEADNWREMNIVALQSEE